MSKQMTPEFDIIFIHPAVVHPDISPPKPSAVLTKPPGTLNQMILESPRALVDSIKVYADAQHHTVIRLTEPFTSGQIAALGDELARLPHIFWLAITARLDTENGYPVNPPILQSGIKLVEWIRPEGRIEAVAKKLKAFSKAGIWNHVNLILPGTNEKRDSLARFAVTNPNIVHSWTVTSPKDNPGFDPIKAVESKILTHSLYSPLAGRPFWRCLPELNHLLFYLGQYGLKKVLRWWIPPDDGAPYVLGEHLDYHFVKPEDLSPDRLEEICQMVTAGGSVDTKWVRYNLKRAFLIAYVTEMDQVVANSSLKHPRTEYITTLNENAGLDLTHYLERGYTSVRPEYRGMGIGTRLLEGLTDRAKGRKIFSLIGEDNIATQKIALRNHTRKITTFYSQRAGKEMGVWMPTLKGEGP